MGRLLIKGPEFISSAYKTRCLICNRIIITRDILLHSKKCSKLFIENFNNNNFARRFYLIHYTLKLDDNFAKNFIFDTEIISFLSQLYDNLISIRQNFPNVGWNHNIFNFQELLILESVFFALNDFSVKLPPGITEYYQALAQTYA